MAFVGLFSLLALLFFIVMAIIPPLRRKISPKFTLKKSLLFGLISFVILIVAAVADPSNSGSSTTTTTAATDKTEDTKSETKAEPTKEPAKEAAVKEEPTKKPEKEEPKVAKIGDSLQVGDVVFAVLKKSDSNKVGNDFMTKEASGRFLILDVAIKNLDKKSITTDSSFFKLKIGDVEYEADGTADMYINAADHMMFLQKINPGIEFVGKIAFDIPADKIDSPDLRLNVQTGFWGTEQDQIALIN